LIDDDITHRPWRSNCAEILIVENCTESYPGCETVWNNDIRTVYSSLIAGYLNTDQLKTFCRYDFFCK